MPNYEYRCLNCNHKFEVYFPYSEYGKTETHCPHCSSEQVQRHIGPLFGETPVDFDHLLRVGIFERHAITLEAQAIEMRAVFEGTFEHGGD